MWFLRRRKRGMLAISGAVGLLAIAALLVAILPRSGVALLQGGPAPDPSPQRPVNGPADPSTDRDPGVAEPIASQDLVAGRAPYTAPLSPSLEVELQIAREELAQLPGSGALVLPPHTAAVVSTTPDSEALTRMYFEAINQVRREQGLSTLTWDEDLAARAQGYAATRLWYWSMDEQGTVWKPRDAEIRQYFGIQHPDYTAIGVSSGLASTSLLETAPDMERVRAIIAGAGYGAVLDPSARVLGVAVVMLTNTTADVPVGWLVMMYQ